jgi:OOP family OmpA-OmpF porin
MSTNSSSNSQADMQALRKLLFEQESTRIDELEKLLLDQKLHAQEVAKVLAEAVHIRNQHDEELGKALAPSIEKSIKASIAKDPKSLSDALFPVMGPAIRKSIQNSIAEMLQSLNQTLEQSFSVQGLKWRIEALRTNKSFAEVVMLNTLVYRVEQVFLIHKETGLLIEHLSFDPSLNEDADVISSMLTAVQDFIRDSFAGSTDQGVENLRMGDLEVVLEQGPHFVLAVVCRGNTPRSFNNKIQAVVEDIQQTYGQFFESFDGDTEDFLGIDEQLYPLLVSDFKGESKQEKKKSPIKAIIVVACIIIGILVWWGLKEAEQSKLRNNWEDYITTLQQEPGLIISNIQKDENTYTIRGLRDPLSIDPYSLLSHFKLGNAQVKFQMQPYHALQSDFVLKRVNQLINPPKSVQLKLEHGTLFISGVASDLWLSQAEKAALYVAGIDNVDSSQVSVLSSMLKENEPNTPIKLDLLPSKPKKTIIRKKGIVHKKILSDPEVLNRTIKLLNPPNTVTMVYAKGILYVSGKASESWIEFAKQNFSRIGQIDSFYTSNLSSKGKQ